MTENKASTPEETPLHEIVLQLMFEANRERPAQLTAKDVFWKFSDATVTENNVIEVLKWLVHQKRVEYVSGRYSLDRFEFLDQKRLDDAVVGPDGKLILPEIIKYDIPLHDVVLQLMFEGGKETPVEYTVDDIYWKILDPSVQLVELGEVLKWLVHHKRVEFQAGKYSLDRFEFLDQIKIEKTAKKVEEPKKAPKSAEKPIKEATKSPKPVRERKGIDPPKVAEKAKVPKSEPVPIPQKVNLKSSSKQEERISRPEINEPEKVEKLGLVNTVLLSLAGLFFAYTFYLLLTSSNAIAPESSKQLQKEIVSAESRLDNLSQIEPNSNSTDRTEERMNLIQEVAQKKSELLTIQYESHYYGLKNLIIRLFLSNLFILLIFATLYYRGLSFQMTKKNE